MTSVVGVHGVGNHLPELHPLAAAERLRSIWAAALAKNGDHGFDLSVAYYAHHLRRSVAQSLDDDPDALDEEERTLLLDWDETLRGHRQVPQGWLTIPPRQLIGGMAGGTWRGLPLQFFVLLVLREVQWYLGKRHQERRIKARDAVAQEIRDRQASVVIAHSLGSVVAYEALWAHPDLEVDLLVTLGSPLAIRGLVFDRLDPKPTGTLAPRPPGVRRWVNLADPGDMIAVPRWLGRSFAVDDDLEAPIGVFDFHRVTKYLACTELGAVLGR